MHETALIVTLTIGLSAALAFGYITQRIGLSPILGYLLAGIAVGPHTPGIFADVNVARQLAEVGVILLMFGVGLHFHVRDLLAVKSIAIPGAIVQSTAATLLGALVSVKLGWPLGAGLVLGLAVSVASTVVLMRVLESNNVLHAREGHAAVGWLVVEDIFTVIALVMLPSVSLSLQGTGSGALAVVLPLSIALVKVIAFALLMLQVGTRVIPWLLVHVARLKSRELFTLAVLVLALAIAAGASFLFGTSIELGAFLAGMVVGQSQVSHQAASDALPMRDAFAVLFFVSVGMLFDPRFFMNNPGLVFAVLAIIMIGKPLAAILIVMILGYSIRTALTVAIGLAQIGEFSFILAQLGNRLGMLPEAGNSAVIACALLSIAVNPLLFRAINPLELWIQKRRVFRVLFNRNAADAQSSACTPGTSAAQADLRPQAIVVGYGPVGRNVTRILQDFGVQPLVIELNIDTVNGLCAAGTPAIYGDAGQRKILEAAGITASDYLLITVPDLASRIPIIVEARELNPEIKIFVRARYLAERSMLEEVGATAVSYEEAEAAVGLADLLLSDLGAQEEKMQQAAGLIRREWALRRD